MRAVKDRRQDGGCNKADDDQNGTTYAGFVFGIGIRIEDLVEERGKRIERADINREGDENDVEGWRTKTFFEGRDQSHSGNL
jgi:hypothetical protein